MWGIDYQYIKGWLDKQDTETLAAILAALECLAEQGPALGRPLVDTLQGSKVPNLKELRPASPGRSEIRIIFAFDPQRKAVMLLAGDKAQGKKGSLRWRGWYKHAIHDAEHIYEAHLSRLEVGNDY